MLIWCSRQKPLLLSSMLKTVVLLHIFVDFFFMILWWIGHSKEHYLFKVEVFCKILNVFTVTFDQFNVSLLNKIIISFKQQEQK